MKGFDNRGQVGEKESNLHESKIAIELSGKNLEIWEKRESRFLERLINSFKKLLGGDIRPEITADEELLGAADALADSAKEALKTPQLKNSERQASVRLKLAEAMEREANARKINLESDKLEMELERERILESQAYIDNLIKRGELIPVEKDGKLSLVYKKRTI